MTPLLTLAQTSASYGKAAILKQLNMVIGQGSITALLGANGAGKTTTLRAICGMVCRTGQIKFNGKSLMNCSTEEIVRLGIAHVPQDRGTFSSLTVEENLRIGAITRNNSKAVTSDTERILTYFPILKQRFSQQAGTLSGGEQQMLAIGRALMLRPSLMLLDEPSFGLAPLITKQVFNILEKIKTEGQVSMLIVEQNAQIALRLADYAYVIQNGRIALEGSPDSLIGNEEIQKSYLGV